MFCAISGSVPEHPVVSVKSGLLFEKTLVEKYVRETGVCPITKETLGSDDLLPLKTNKAVKPRTAASTSIPGMLGLFHDEWDALMLETHSLRTSLNSVRQELSHALYQHDSACRVIARVMRERDEARAALSAVRETVEAEVAAKRSAPGGAAAGAEGASAAAAADAAPAKKARVNEIPEAVVRELAEVNAALSKPRKKRPVSESLASIDSFSTMALLGSHALHKVAAAGITSLDVQPGSKGSVVASGGADSTVQVYDVAASRVLASLEGHGKRVSAVSWLSPEVLLSSSTDKTVRVWQAPRDGGSSYSCLSVLRDHSKEVVGVTPHPSHKYFVTASSDATWAFYDLATLTCLRQASEEGSSDGYTTVQFHPDGQILGTGTDKSAIRIWEIRQAKSAASFEGHSSPVTSLSFSENGYYLASAAADCVKLWDLRKLKNFKTLEPYDDGSACLTVSFDYSGQFLAVGGADARVYSIKAAEATLVRTFTDFPKRGVAALRFGADAKTLLAGSGDHNLRVFGNAPAAMQE
ncbi:MAG: hypothetical protein WDW38_005580 [Sanguina aurantia]